MGLIGKKAFKRTASTPDPSSNASSPRHSEQQADMKVAPEAALLGIGGGEKHTRKSAVSKHSTCTFFMLSADFVRKFPGKSLPFFQDLRDKFTTDEPLVEVSLDYADVVKGTHMETTLAVSHRWMQPDHPDPDGGKKIERVWIDSACMPQDLPKGSRSAEDAAAFKRMLKEVNRLYLGTTVLILLDMSYVSRFWTQFESWMSMQYTTPSGLKSAVGTRNERHHIVCIQNAAAQAESFAKLLVDQWAKKTPQQAHSFLSKPDVTVTNQSDKEAQLPKIKALDTTVQGAFSEVAREIEEELAASEVVAARAEAELTVWEAENEAKASEKHWLKVAALHAASAAAAAREAKKKHEQAIAIGVIPAIMEQRGAASEVYEPWRPPCLYFVASRFCSLCLVAPLRLAGRCAPASLDLSDMGLGPAIAPLIAGNAVLTHLDLGANRIRDQGAAAIAEALRGNEVLTTLNLRLNGIGDEGAAALGEALRGNAVLTSLDVRNNEIGSTGATAIADALKGNAVLTTLNLANNQIRDQGAAAIADALRGNVVLTSLDVSYNSLTEEAALGIVRVERQRNKLTSLRLASCGIGPTGAAEIAEYVSGSGVMTTLNLEGNNIRAEGAAALASALRVNGVLTSLDVGFNDLTEEAALGIVRVERQRNKLTSLGLPRCSIGPTGAAEIAEYVSGSGVLNTLNIGCNEIGPTGAAAFAEALRGNAVLTDLSLGWNEIGAEGATAIAESLRGNEVLTSLDLCNNNIRDEGAKAIGKALAVNGVLTNLVLRNNNIGDEGAKALAAALRVNGVLTTLDLHFNYLREGVIRDAVSGRVGFELKM